MKVQIKVPAVGESITEATIAEWTKNSGDFVERDEVLLVLETEKASVEVVAEQAGQLEITQVAGETIEIGSVVGSIDTSVAGQAKPAQTKTAESAPEAQSMPQQKGQSSSHGKSELSPEALNEHSPAARRALAEHQLNPQDINGSGKGGRLLKEDIERAAQAPSRETMNQSGAAEKAPSGAESDTAGKSDRKTNSNGVRREKMSNIRKRIAQRLVEAQQTAAILTTFNEIDMSQVMALREKYKEGFKEKHGIGLGFMGFFVKAVVKALQQYPRVNAFIEGDEVVFNEAQHVGIAVGTEKGLMVPVIRDCQELSIAQIESEIRTFAKKARDGKISIDDLSGGTFTISNGGVYGSLMSTPILNPPQSAILGMHKIEDRPIAVNGQVVIRPMMYVALSYDHRIIDGAESVSFLVKIKEGIEDPARLLLDI